MIINKDFREFIALLRKNDVRYLIVGGYAVAFHGHPRYTKDLDVWIWMDQHNAQRLLTALNEFGFHSLDLQPEDFCIPGYVIQLGYPPSRIDLLTAIDGIVFEDCYADRIEIEVEGTIVNFIDLENLKKNKKASGRHQDLADLENLQP